MKTAGDYFIKQDQRIPLLIPKGKELKKFYHNFKHNDREITLCLLVVKKVGVILIKVGYSICVPEDKYDRELGKKIALGRARKDKFLGVEILLEEHLALDNGVLKAIAWNYEKRVKKGEIEIKGIR